MSVQHLNKEYKVIRTTGRTDTKDIHVDPILILDRFTALG